MDIIKHLISTVDELIAGAEGGGGGTASSPAMASLRAVRDLHLQHTSVERPRARLHDALKDLRVSDERLGYYRTTTRRIALDKLTQQVLKLPDEERSAREAEWAWLLANSPPGTGSHAPRSEWDTRSQAFLAAFRSRLETLTERHGLEGALFNAFINNLRNLPRAAHECFHQAANAHIPVALLYAASMKEGLDKYFLRQFPGQQHVLTDTQLGQARVDVEVDGFAELGIDTFFTELNSPGRPHPLSGFLPAGFMKKVEEKEIFPVAQLNETGAFDSANAKTLLTGLQAMAAMLARFQALFLEDAANLGFAAPSVREKVFWTYLYYSTGPGDRSPVEGEKGYHALYAHRPDHPDATKRRALGDWIARGEYPHVTPALRTYDAVVDGDIFPGY